MTSRYRQPSTLAFTVTLESPINLACKSFDGGKKLEHPEKTQAITGRTSKLHSARAKVAVRVDQRVVTVLPSADVKIFSISLRVYELNASW